MWIFTSRGFLSIVKHRDKPQMMLVRARAAGHIETHFPQATVIRTVAADYRYRADVPSLQVAMMIAAEVSRVNYDNFKNSIPKTPEGDRYHNAAMRVWGVMNSYQTDGETPKKPVTVPTAAGEYIGGAGWWKPTKFIDADAPKSRHQLYRARKKLIRHISKQFSPDFVAAVLAENFSGATHLSNLVYEDLEELLVLCNAKLMPKPTSLEAEIATDMKAAGELGDDMGMADTDTRIDADEDAAVEVFESERTHSG